MAQLILDWLNEEVRLSRRVFSLEHDFKDGYLLGELLHKYNQQSNFDKFSMKGNSTAKITNFSLLEPSMRQIGVNFNAKIAFDVMHATNGTSKDLVYDMRATLEGIRKRSCRSAIVSNEKPLSNSGKILTVLRHGTPLFDKTMMTTFENSVRAMMENPNDILMEQITRKFDQKKMDFRQTVSSSHSMGMDTMELELTKRRDLQKHSKKHGKEFTNALDLINEDQWKKNQRVAHERRAREERFDKTATQRRDFLKTSATSTVRNNVLSEIDEFESRLESDIFKDDTNLKRTVGQALKRMLVEDPGSKLIDTTFLDKAVLQSGLLLSKKTLREKNEDKRKDESGKDRRRRRFLGEREISHRTSLKQAAASEIIQQLLNPSQSEIFEAQYLSRVVLQKDLITENRINRDQLIAELNEAEVKRMELWKQEETAREIEWVIGHKIAAQNEKLAALEEARQAADRERDLVVSNAALMRMRRIEEWVESCNKLGLFEPTDAPSEFSAYKEGYTGPQLSVDTLDRATIPSSIFWDDAKLMLLSDIDVTKPLPSVNETKIFRDLPYSLSEQLSHVDSKWLLAKPFRTHNVMPAKDSLSLVTAESSVVELLTGEGEGIIIQAFESSDDSESKRHKGVKFIEAGDRDVSVLHEDSVTLSGSVLDGIPDGSVAYPNPTYDDRWAEDTEREISEYLAVCDYNKFMYETANVQIAGYEMPPAIPVIERPPTPVEKKGAKVAAVVVVEVEEVPIDPALLVQAPSWLLSTPAKYLLGEVIVALRCAAEAEDLTPDPKGETPAETPFASAPQTPMAQSVRPSFAVGLNPGVAAVVAAVAESVNAIPPAVRFEDNIDGAAGGMIGQAAEVLGLIEEEVKVDLLPVFSVRLALCGVSELARKAVSEAVSTQSEGTVRIIRVEQLVSDAVSLGATLKSEIDASVDEFDEGVMVTVDCEDEDEGEMEIELPHEDEEEEKGVDYERHELALRALSIVLAGETIPDDVYVALVIQAIRDLGVERAQQQQPPLGDGEGKELEPNPETVEATPAPPVKEITGYIIEDFPTTKNQALLLVEALSGINYEEKMPQVADKASPFAPLMPYEDVAYDIALCGLDTVLFLQTDFPLGVQTTLAEIISARTNLDTNEVVYLQAGSDLIVENLEELRSAVCSPHTAVIDIAMTSSGADNLQIFLKKVGVLKVFDMSAYGSLGEGAGIAADLMNQGPQTQLDPSSEIEEQLDNLNIIDSLDIKGQLEGDMEGVENDGVILPMQSEEARPVSRGMSSRLPSFKQPDIEGEERKNSVQLGPKTPIVPAYTLMPKDLAKALSNMWSAAENQSTDTGRSFFNSLRDSRYKMVQRRRALHDALSMIQTRLDNRQETFDEFVRGFNAMDDDFRFDNECAAELHLRGLELREVLLGACDMRKREAELFVARAAVDGISPLLSHLSECEGAAMLQAEYNRFIIALHLLFDYTKSMASYDKSKKTLNLLEETLPLIDENALIPIMSGSGSGKMERKISNVGGKKPPLGKKGSVSMIPEIFPDPFRVPVPPISLPLTTMTEIPRQTIIVDPHNEDDVKLPSAKSGKGKGDAKGRSRSGSNASTATEVTEKPAKVAPQNQAKADKDKADKIDGPGPFQLMEKAVMDLAVPWGKDVFRVNNVLYERDQMLMVLLENAVWHECERLRCSVQAVRKIVDLQNSWLSDTESSLLAIFHRKIIERHNKECSSVERLVNMVGECIDSAEQIKNQWLLAPDVIVVSKNVLLDYPESPPIIPNIEKYHDDKLNRNQKKMLKIWLDSVSLGNVLLEQDLLSLMDRALSPIGPYCTESYVQDGVFNHLTLPKKWRALEIVSEHPLGFIGVINSGFSRSGSSNQSEKEPRGISVNDSEMMRGIRKHIFHRDKVHGVDEHAGTVYLDSVLEILGDVLAL